MEAHRSIEEPEDREDCEGPFWSGVPSGTRKGPRDGPRVPEGTPPGKDIPCTSGRFSAPSTARPVVAVNSELADAIDAELAEEDAYWERIWKDSRIYETVEQLRDAVDVPRWRDTVAQKRLARDAARQPSREIDSRLGAVRGRPSRQINVKLSEPDFEALKSLAVQSDLPPSTMARILVRRAIAEAAGLPLRQGPRRG